MNNLQTLKQQYLGSLSLTERRKEAEEVLKQYLTLLEDTHRIDEYNSMPGIREHVIDFIIKEKFVPKKQLALDCLKGFWAFATPLQGWTESPLTGLLENVPRTELERQLAVLYLIQESGKTLEELSEKLLFEEATIRSDVNYFCDSKGFDSLIVESDRDGGQTKYTFNAHPFALAYNLTQIGDILLGINQAIQNEAPHSRSFSRLYQDLWLRLTPYGKEHMLSLGLLEPDSLPPLSSLITEQVLLDGLHIHLIHSLKTQSPVRIRLQRGTETEEDYALVLDLGQPIKQRLLTIRSTSTEREYKIPLAHIVDVQLDQH